MHLLPRNPCNVRIKLKSTGSCRADSSESNAGKNQIASICVARTTLLCESCLRNSSYLIGARGPPYTYTQETHAASRSSWMDLIRVQHWKNQVVLTAAAETWKKSLRESCLRDCLSNRHVPARSTARGPRLNAAAYKRLSSTTMSQDIQYQSVDVPGSTLR